VQTALFWLSCPFSHRAGLILQGAVFLSAVCVWGGGAKGRWVQQQESLFVVRRFKQVHVTAHVCIWCDELPTIAGGY
jgi:hypothetical protein